MQPPDRRDLNENLRVEVEAALAGEVPQSVVLLQCPDRLPRALVTDVYGVTHPRVITYADLLGTLDQSTIIDQLEHEPERRLPLPQLPPGTVLVDLVERAATSVPNSTGTTGSNSYVVTGVLPARTHLFTLQSGPAFGEEQTDKETSTYEIVLPPIVYRALYNEALRNVTELSVALLSPELEGDPAPHTQVFRYPFSNVYSNFQNVVEGVCWYQKQDITLSMHQLPDLVKRFVSIPNDPTHYTRDLTHNAPAALELKGYAPFLEAIEKGGGIPHDWLVPAGLTIQELHQKKGRTE
jgi:hypothetical protein